MTETVPELMQAFGRCIRSQEAPREIIEAATRLTEYPEELFFFEPDAEAAAGTRTVYVGSGLQPTDLLLELVQAARAAQWEQVLVLIRPRLTSHEHRSTATVGD